MRRGQLFAALSVGYGVALLMHGINLVFAALITCGGIAYLLCDR